VSLILEHGVYCVPCRVVHVSGVPTVGATRCGIAMYGVTPLRALPISVYCGAFSVLCFFSVSSIFRFWYI